MGNIAAIEVFLQALGSAVVAVLIGGFAPLVGVALGWEPLGVWLGAAVGSTLLMLIVIFGAGPIRDRVVARFAKKGDNKDGKVRQLYDRYGVKGLAVVAPLVVGPAIALIAALVFGVPRTQFATWYTAGVFVGFGLLTVFWVLVL